MCIQEMPTPSEFHHVCSKGFFFPFFKFISFRHCQALPNNTYSVIPMFSYASGELAVAVVILLLLLFSCLLDFKLVYTGLKEEYKCLSL